MGYLTFPSSIEEERLTQMKENIIIGWKGKKVLYIGANPFRFHFKSFLEVNNCIVDVIEIVPEACEYLKGLDWLRNVYCDDIRNIKNYKEKYDIILWSHGPETLEMKSVSDILNSLETMGKAVILMCPWGIYHYPEGHEEAYSNITSFYGNYFVERGYKVDTLGQKDVNGSNLLAWKIKE